MHNNYFESLKSKMDLYAHSVYRVSRMFPKEETYGVTSQLRRSALSVILNYIEGFARQRNSVKKNFWEISYGSLKESNYLLLFSLEEKYISKKDYDEIVIVSDEIGAMLWKAIKSVIV